MVFEATQVVALKHIRISTRFGMLLFFTKLGHRISCWVFVLISSFISNKQLRVNLDWKSP